MTKILYVGDPHVTVGNMDESDSLMTFVAEQALAHKVDMIVLLGDLQNNFANVRTEVIDFWKEWLPHFADIAETFALVGNHDQANSADDAYKSNSLSIFSLIRNKKLHIVESPLLWGKFLMMPYMHDQAEFAKTVNEVSEKLGTKVLICHQDINGSTYENGFYAPGGVDPKILKYDLIIGGHIHKRQRFDKVILPGTARWLTASDANEPKGLWLVEHEENTGKILKEEFLDTSSVCTPLLSIVWTEGSEKPEFPSNAKVAIELVGSSTWVTKQKSSLKGKVSIRTKITDSKRAERMNSGKNLFEYALNGFDYLPGIDKNQVVELLRSINV